MHGPSIRMLIRLSGSFWGWSGCVNSLARRIGVKRGMEWSALHPLSRHIRLACLRNATSIYCDHISSYQEYEYDCIKKLLFSPFLLSSSSRNSQSNQPTVPFFTLFLLRFPNVRICLLQQSPCSRNTWFSTILCTHNIISFVRNSYCVFIALLQTISNSQLNIAQKWFQPWPEGKRIFRKKLQLKNIYLMFSDSPLLFKVPEFAFSGRLLTNGVHSWMDINAHLTTLKLTLVWYFHQCSFLSLQ